MNFHELSSSFGSPIRKTSSKRIRYQRKHVHITLLPINDAVLIFISLSEWIISPFMDNTYRQQFDDDDITKSMISFRIKFKKYAGLHWRYSIIEKKLFFIQTQISRVIMRSSILLRNENYDFDSKTNRVLSCKWLNFWRKKAYRSWDILIPVRKK